jgi:hypothetical protein
MKRILFGLLGLILAPIVVYAAFGLWSFAEGQDLRVDKAGIETIYLFTFPAGREVIIRDKHSQIKRSWGRSAESMVTRDGVRTVVFDGPAILKSEIDSIEPQADRVNLKGYMGVTTQDLNFTVDKNGTISSDNWRGG